MLLRDKNAVIYGAGGAIGGAVARAFSREGAKLFLAGRTLAKVEAVAAEISSAGRIAEAAGVDARDEREVESHVEAVVAKCGRIDVLFNAIGMEDIQGTPLIEMPLDDFAHPVVIAATTQFLTARAVARRMVTQGSGAILSVTAEPAREAASNIGGGSASPARPSKVSGELSRRSLGRTASASSACVQPGRPRRQISSTSSRSTLKRRDVPSRSRRRRLEVERCSGAFRPWPRSPTWPRSWLRIASAITGSFINVTCGSPVD